MQKNVKITITSMMPVTCTGMPLTRGTHGPMMLDTKDIFKLLINGASVKELIAGGEQILTLANFNTQFTSADIPNGLVDKEDIPQAVISETPKFSISHENKYLTTEDAPVVEQELTYVEESVGDDDISTGSPSESPQTNEEEPAKENVPNKSVAPSQWIAPKKGTQNNNNQGKNKGRR